MLPLLIAVQELCAGIGLVTGKGHVATGLIVGPGGAAVPQATAVPQIQLTPALFIIFTIGTMVHTNGITTSTTADHAAAATPVHGPHSTIIQAGLRRICCFIPTIY